MIDHFNLPVRDLEASRGFYDAVLQTLGARVLFTEADVLGYGTDHWAFGLVLDPVGGPVHLAFRALSTEQVDTFYAAGLAAGGICNGAPGERGEYGKGYYACYLRDPDGNNIEAVLRGGT